MGHLEEAVKWNEEALAIDPNYAPAKKYLKKPGKRWRVQLLLHKNHIVLNNLYKTPGFFV